MRFGIVAPATPDLIVHCETAETLGFEAAWLFDSHMVYSDVYVIMALYAHRTRRMTFGTGIAVAPPRGSGPPPGSELGGRGRRSASATPSRVRAEGTGAPSRR
jgi:hypothetical protein